MTSGYVASMPRQCEPDSRVSTACKTLDAIKSVFAGRVKQLPIRARKTAKFRKLDASDTLYLDVHEFASVLAEVTPEDAIFILERLTEDSAKDEHISLTLAGVRRAPSLVIGEAEAAIGFSEFMCVINKHSDARLVQQAYIGATARLRSCMLAQESES